MSWNEPGKGRDPWGGRDGQDPQDFDEMVRGVQRKLRGLFGGGGRRGEGSGTLAIFVVIGIALLLFDAIHIIEPSERGVVLRFGAHVATLGPGPAIRMPRPIERVVRVNVEQVSQYTHKALMLTQDENIVDIELGVQFRRSDAPAYVFNVANPDATLQAATESAIREVAGKTTLDFILGAGRAEVAQATLALLQQTLDAYRTGIDVVAVNLVDAQPPEQVQAAFEDAIKAREDQVRIINEAQAYANDILPRARGAAARLVEEANAYRESKIARAQGEASRFLQILAEYEQAPAVTRERLYLETVESVLSASRKVLVDTDNSGNLMYLPLDQLMRGDLRPQPLPSDGSARSSQPTQSTTPARTRDGARSRNP